MKIALCLIVKNEAHVVRRCIESTLPLIDYVLVVDTGSTDGTQKVVADFLAEKGIDGVVLDEPWRDFGYNRSFALRKLREHEDVDYGLMIDADEELVFEDGFDAAKFKAGLDKEFYNVLTRYGDYVSCGIVYPRAQLFSNRVEFYFRGVLHEVLHCDRPTTSGTAGGFYDHPIQDGARGKNPRKFRDDAAVLEAALSLEKDSGMIARYTFYLAQCYRECGEWKTSREIYRRRAAMGGWAEEAWYSLYQVARLTEHLNAPHGEVLAAYLEAYDKDPRRAEPLYWLARRERLAGRYGSAVVFARAGVAVPCPSSILFVERDVYEWKLLDELSISLWWAGYQEESSKACEQLFRCSALPSSERSRVESNLSFDRTGARSRATSTG
jgi:glycosyltransferase involved in cell wall biosynthesis